MPMNNLCPGSAEVNQTDCLRFHETYILVGEREKNNEQINICQVVINDFSCRNYLTNIQ